MKTSWRLFKYSRLCQTKQDHNILNPHSQTITHCKYDTKNIQEQTWQQIFMENSKNLEISINNKSLEIKLFITKEKSYEMITLERMDLNDKIVVLYKKRTAGFKMNDKQFQVVFFSDEEILNFKRIFNEEMLFNYTPFEENECEKKEFISKIQVLNGKTRLSNKFKTNKKYDLIRSELIKIFKD
ncbi:hypothetical protein TCON_1458 [Astathelohania contejeani]|uniref:Uncharacterized protein n=1 Tax=Astathelohania contejeani TaxID=164912 RepID=A0ABQ7HYQ0_9MICR|nr:hypothetical protein TCON_1458 [Thelohania contejeani]